MPNILAIESVTTACSVSLLTKNGQFNRFIDNEQKPSSLVLNLCSEVLSESGLDLAQIDCIAYNRGPGSFTGIRLGLGVVQGLSLAHNIATVGFSTFEILAYPQRQKLNFLLVVLDARMSEVYWADVQRQKVLNMAVQKPSTMPKFANNYLGIGNGWEAYGGVLAKQTGIDNIIANQVPNAKYLARLCAQYYPHQINQPVEALYLRNQVVKVAR